MLGQTRRSQSPHTIKTTQLTRQDSMVCNCWPLGRPVKCCASAEGCCHPYFARLTGQKLVYPVKIQTTSTHSKQGQQSPTQSGYKGGVVVVSEGGEKLQPLIKNYLATPDDLQKARIGVICNTHTHTQHKGTVSVVVLQGVRHSRWFKNTGVNHGFRVQAHTGCRALGTASFTMLPAAGGTLHFPCLTDRQAVGPGHSPDISQSAQVTCGSVPVSSAALTLALLSNSVMTDRWHSSAPWASNCSAGRLLGDPISTGRGWGHSQHTREAQHSTVGVSETWSCINRTTYPMHVLCLKRPCSFSNCLPEARCTSANTIQ